MYELYDEDWELMAEGSREQFLEDNDGDPDVLAALDQLDGGVFEVSLGGGAAPLMRMRKAGEAPDATARDLLADLDEALAAMLQPAMRDWQVRRVWLAALRARDLIRAGLLVDRGSRR